MSLQNMLDQMLAAGKGLAQQGQDLATQHLNLPPAGPERDQALANLGTGALGGVALALLLGNRGGRRLAGTAATLGGLAALGKVAFDAFQNWQAKQGGQGEAAAPSGAPSAEQSVAQLTGEAGEQRARALFKAMIAAAKADGHLDDEERGRLTQAIAQLGLDQDTRLMLDAELARPLDPADVAAGADSPEAAAEIYLASLFLIDVDSPEERSYLDRLAAALNLAPGLAAQLEQQASAA